MSTLSRGLLAFTAGFVDTATFVHLGGLFAAHVTGNFVVFAAALSQGLAIEDFLKLVTFPVFVLAVLMGTAIHQRALRRSPKRAHLPILAVEGVLLLGSGVVSLVASRYAGTADLGALDVALALALVVAMGLQNSLHRFVPGPMTTVMTGNVTQLTTLIGRALLDRKPASERAAASEGERPWASSLTLLAGFAGGCVVSAITTRPLGLVTVLGCGVLITGVIAIEARAAAHETA